MDAGTMNGGDDGDRRPRFSAPEPLPTRGQRAASQPPTSHASSPLYAHREGESGSVSPSVSLGGGPWKQAPRFPQLSRAMTMGASVMPVPPPTRSASFSGGGGGAFPPSLRAERTFPSTFEDDEDDWLAEGDGDDVDFRYSSRAQLADMTRSRSQSLATPGRSGLTLNTAGMPIPGSSGVPSQWVESPRASRYGEIGRPRGGMASSPLASGAIPIGRPSAGGGGGGGGYSSSSVDVSNMSPFVRDVNRIVLDENAALRELWGTMHGHNLPTEHMGGNGGSGTTSRRHSVSVVQPRRGFGNLVSPGGLGGLEHDDMLGSTGGFGSRQLLLSDDDLASDLAMLNFKDGPGPSSHGGPPSQPASLPIYAGPHPHTGRAGTGGGGGMLAPHSPVDSTPGGGRYVPMNLTRGASGSGRLASVERRDMSRSPGTSPARHDLRTTQDTTPVQHPHPLQSPQPQQQQQPQQRFEPPLTELGRGVPLHAVPSNVPLYIVEFKAGRTDLFYCVDPALDVRVGDLVIVEADRGKDLGKVVNDSITPADIEALQIQAAGSSGEPVSPGGPMQSSKREYNPKRIYGKAQPQDTQTLVAKMNDEMKALQLCQTKVKQKKLPMEVVDAEYQWDRRKLTFYFVAEKRIDFRELVRELFRLYKTRIWMSSLQAPAAE